MKKMLVAIIALVVLISACGGESIRDRANASCDTKKDPAVCRGFVAIMSDEQLRDLEKASQEK